MIGRGRGELGRFTAHVRTQPGSCAPWPRPIFQRTDEMTSVEIRSDEMSDMNAAGT